MIRDQVPISSRLSGETRTCDDTTDQIKTLFGEVWVVNLKRRPDRLTAFQERLTDANWPFREPLVYYAIDGGKVALPKVWRTGAGSYGCLRSHMNILEQAIMNDVESLLVLEDDAVFVEDFDQKVSEFLAKVPDDWQCLMLGGQHVNSKPVPVAPGVVRAGKGGGIQRTHCYALRGHTAIRSLYRTWANAAVHCDWVMGPVMARLKTYAPHPFLVGQSDGRSDISGRVNSVNFWRHPDGKEPVIVLHAPREVMEALVEKGFHPGHNRDPKTGFNIDLCNLLADKTFPVDKRDAQLKDWIRAAQWEVLSLPDPAVCTIWRPEVRGDVISSLIDGPVVQIIAKTVESALSQVPPDIQSIVQ